MRITGRYPGSAPGYGAPTAGAPARRVDDTHAQAGPEPMRIATDLVRPAQAGTIPARTLVARLGLVSGWQLRRLLRCKAADLPGRLVRAGVLTGYVLEGPLRLPRLYGPGPGVPSSIPLWDGLAAVKQVAANQFLVRLQDLGEARGAAFCTDWGPGLAVVRGEERFTVVAFREGREEEQRFLAFLGRYRPGEGKTVVVAASVSQLIQLSLLARERICPLRLTWDGALFHLPLARAFCRVGNDGPEPVLMSGLGVDAEGGVLNNEGDYLEQGCINRPFGQGTGVALHGERHGSGPPGPGRRPGLSPSRPERG